MNCERRIIICLSHKCIQSNKKYFGLWVFRVEYERQKKLLIIYKPFALIIRNNNKISLLKFIQTAGFNKNKYANIWSEVLQIGSMSSNRMIFVLFLHKKSLALLLKHFTISKANKMRLNENIVWNYLLSHRWKNSITIPSSLLLNWARQIGLRQANLFVCLSCNIQIVKCKINKELVQTSNK